MNVQNRSRYGAALRAAAVGLCLTWLLAACVVEESGRIVFTDWPPAPRPVPAAADAPLPEAPPAPLPPSPAETARAGLETGFTADGYPYLGSPAAPIVLVEYTDLHCPYCRRHSQETLPRLREQYIATGQVQYVAKDLPLEALHPQARAAHRAAWCMALQSTDAFWWMRERLLATQMQHARGDDAHAFFEELARAYNEEAVPPNRIDAGAFAACQSDRQNEVGARIDRAIEDATAAKLNGTPSFLLYFRDAPARRLPVRGAQAFDVFADAIENLAEYLAALEERQARASALPFWITDAGLAPVRLWESRADADADAALWHTLSGMTQARDHFEGSPLAEVIVFEFSDFDCPYCQRHQRETQPVLHERYIATAKVMWVQKHFPLPIHPFAPYAAEAALCAGEQGRYTEMARLLYAQSEQWAHPQHAEALRALGRQLASQAAPGTEIFIPDSGFDDLDAASVQEAMAQWEQAALPAFNATAFDACLAGDQYEEAVAQGMADVEGIVRGTPTFLIWHRRYGALAQPIVGSLQKEQFVGVFEQIFTRLATPEEADQ